MTTKELEQQINDLPDSDKAQLLQTLFFALTDIWPGIEKTPGVMGGDACIVRTRIPIWALEQYRRLGWTEAQILENYPSLRSARPGPGVGLCQRPP